jgi:hypothetical protein
MPDNPEDITLKRFCRCGLAILLLLAGCGDLPRPFAGNPGATARMLAQPPPSRLAVRAPTGAMLGDRDAVAFAAAVAHALQDAEVPAITDPPRRGDWQLQISAELRQGRVIPSYAVLDPEGAERGQAEGIGIDPAAWADAGTPTVAAAALVAAPRIAAMLARIEAERRRSDPASLANRPPRVFLRPVAGAPGDGNISLARQMRLELAKSGHVLQDSAEGADYTVAGDVLVVPAAGKLERVEIQWRVTDARGEERGKVVQLNEIPAGSLRGFWADIAVVVAQEAAGGVRDVILNQTDRKPAP